MTTSYVTHVRYVEHHLAGHPEHAGRIRSVWAMLENTGLRARMTSREAEMVDEEAILAVHTRDYVKLLRWVGETQQAIVHLDADTYAGPTVLDVARLSAGGVVGAVDDVLSGRAHNGLAAVRPPGHHAMPDHAMGFCVLGNVPIATRYAQQVYGIRRVMIMDFDVHHGNGTEAMFYDDDSVLFISTHQYPFYPGTGALSDTGRGKGEGFTINIPLGPGHGDASYRTLFEKVVWPAAMRFEPEMILVSAGFDAHWTDPLAGMRLSLTGYAHLTSELIRMADTLCQGRIVFAMEGGYNLEALSHGMANIARLLLGDTDISDPSGSPRDERKEPAVDRLVEELRDIHHLNR